MERLYNFIFFKSTRLYKYSLVFFLCLVIACQPPKSNQVSIVWKDGKAKGILIPGHLMVDIEKYSPIVSLNGSEQEVLGNFIETDTGMLFEPVIPLSAGMEYGVIQANRVVGKVKVPYSPGTPPKVSAIYPQSDTVPENLLKLYIEFSEPMRTGSALEHVFLLDKNQDTLDRIFLNLQPELWDSTDRVLTLWIDPGRIKRDLVLNKELGNPLHSKQAYELVISGKWKDRRGSVIGKDVRKKFIAGARADHQLDIDQWRISAPKPGTNEALIIYLDTPLDHYLLKESLTILYQGKPVKGEIRLADKDKAWIFTPDSRWSAGPYTLRALARLEDLAGNNLNKVFDRDIYKQKKNDNVYYNRQFEVK